jgi:hypothetical protein
MVGTARMAGRAGLFLGCVAWGGPVCGSSLAALQPRSGPHLAHAALPVVSLPTPVLSGAGVDDNQGQVRALPARSSKLDWMFSDAQSKVATGPGATGRTHGGLSTADGGDKNSRQSSWRAALSTDSAGRGWDQQLVSAGDNRHQLKHRFGLFGPSIVTELRTDMLSLDPRIDGYSSSRYVFDQISIFAIIVGTIIGLLLLWDTGGLGVCLGEAVGDAIKSTRSAPHTSRTSESDGAGSLSLNPFQGLAGSKTARDSTETGGAKEGVNTSRSAPGTFPNVAGMFGMGKARSPTNAAPAAEYGAVKQDEPHRATAAAPTAHAVAAASNGPTLAQRMRINSMFSHKEDDEQQIDRNLQSNKRSQFVLPGLGLEKPWVPTPTLFFVLGFFCQLPLMIALCCYSFFAEMFAGAGADGLSYFPVIVALAQLVTSASVSTVLREWNWMLKAVLGLLVAVPAVLVVPVSVPYPTQRTRLPRFVFCFPLPLRLEYV